MSPTAAPYRHRQDLATGTLLSSQWTNPADIFSVLLIIGGEVIQKALAQLSGNCLVPVAFSFGWVAYSLSTLMAIVGDGRLMPAPDHPAKVINVESGYTRENKSWVLGRLLRDFEFPLPGHIRLHITVFRAVAKEAGYPVKDWYWASGLLVILMQLGIAAIPVGLSNDWGIILVTVWGTVLALLTGSLPQWRFEKWACRKNTTKKLILTGGNGTRHVMYIIGDGKGLDLEDLAAVESPRMGSILDRLAKPELDEHRIAVNLDSEGRPERKVREFRNVPVSFLITQVACSTLAAVWIVLLITVVGLKENAWYLLAIGGLGMIQNVVVAGARRGKGTTGIHLQEIERYGQEKVMDALMDLESKYENVGKSLLAEFFNAKLRPDEEIWWDGTNKEPYDRKRKHERYTSWEMRTEFLKK